MSVEKLREVLDLVHEKFPNTKRVRTSDLERTIMQVCGTCRSTVLDNKKALVKLGWIKTNKNHVILLKSRGPDWLVSERPPPVEKPSQSDEEFVGRGDVVLGVVKKETACLTKVEVLSDGKFVGGGDEKVLERGETGFVVINNAPDKDVCYADDCPGFKTGRCGKNHVEGSNPNRSRSYWG